MKLGKQKKILEAREAFRAREIEFEELTQVHWKLRDGHDFWPSTGKWYDYEARSYGQGLNSLLLRLGYEMVERPEPVTMKVVVVQKKRRRLCTPACAESTLTAVEVLDDAGEPHLQQRCERCDRRVYLPRAWGIAAGTIGLR